MAAPGRGRAAGGTGGLPTLAGAPQGNRGSSTHCPRARYGQAYQIEEAMLPAQTAGVECMGTGGLPPKTPARTGMPQWALEGKRMDIIPLGRFGEALREDLEALRRHARKGSWSDLLALWVARHFLKLDDAQALRACGMQGPGEEGIDLFWVEHGGKRVIVGQAEAAADLKLARTFSRGVIDKLRRAVAALNDQDLAEDRQSPIASAIDDYNDALAKGYSVEFWAIIGGTADKGLVRASSRFQKADLGRYPRHSMRIQDAASLLTQYCTDVERLPYPDIALELPRREHFKHGANSILATVSAKSIARAVREKGLHIFESNARLPLLGSPINKEIAATLGEREGRDHLWDLNNGLTVICDDFSRPDRQVRLQGAQIVNGCQTAFTLFKNIDRLSHAQVICRIIRRVDRAQSDRIRRATNLQNAMLERDLRSGDRVQKVLQMGFRRRRYFYERKRDEYRNYVAELGKANVAAQFPKGPVDNLYLAQLALAFWHEQPAPAKMQAKRIFVKAAGPSEEDLPEGFYDIVFPDDVTTDELLLPLLVSNYMYDKFKVGYRPQGVRRTRRYMIQTHGNLTVLALIGWAVRHKYRLQRPLRGSGKQLLSNLLIPRFESVHDFPEYLREFNRGVRVLLDGLDAWTERATRRQSREEGRVDLRKIFISSSTYPEILRDRRMRNQLTRTQRYMPDLAA
jgi:AIPR protein